MITFLCQNFNQLSRKYCTPQFFKNVNISGYFVANSTFIQGVMVRTWRYNLKSIPFSFIYHCSFTCHGDKVGNLKKWQLSHNSSLVLSITCWMNGEYRNILSNLRLIDRLYWRCEKSQQWSITFGLRPYHTESTRTRPIPEVKQCRAQIVLG